MNVNELIAPERYNLTEEIEKHASDKVALKWENDQGEQKEITYNQLIGQGNQLANALIKLGLTKGDRVLVVVPRLIESYVVYFACLKAGLVIIPSSELLRAKDISYRINHAEAKAVISFADFCQEVDHIQEEIPSLQVKLTFGGEVDGWMPMEQLMGNESDQFERAETTREDIAFLPYTSGTTGQPKGVVHRHGWAYAHLRIAADKWLAIGENDKVWATAGPGWQKWVWSPFLSVLGKGATGFVYYGRFEPRKYLQLLQDQKINVLCCTPTEYRLMAKVDHLYNFDLSNLHSAVSAGEALNREVMDVFKRHFNVQVRDGYGQTESTLLIGTLKGMEIRPGSMGKPILKDFIDIIDENGEPIAAGEVGDIAVRKEFGALFQSYYKDPERTARAFRGNYFVTGDRACKDSENYYWFEGRSDDIIISSGYTIGPFEVEDALMKHPGVKECAVVASPDPIRGNVVKAFIILKEGYSGEDALTKELQDHVKRITAPYKYPRLIEFVEELPKTDSGKIRRVELRKRELQRAEQMNMKK
ncbi:acyl-CoA synthetase MbcS [Bacillus songklensis]|uniref:Acyl-CoA synthetase MbcS n=1 Tax=Bacillus songklensis TaxID=1069116 RepID=A0ABV8B940_9BACI